MTIYADTPSIFQEKIIKIAELLEMDPNDVYLFGGAIRDSFLKKTPSDYDFLVQTNMEDLNQYR